MDDVIEIKGNIGLCTEMSTVKEYIEMIKKRKPGADIVEQILPDEPGAYIILAGRTGLKKTMLCMNLAYSIATGTPFLGLKCRKTSVFYFALEGNDKNLMDRLERMSRHFPDTGDLLRFDRLPVRRPSELYENVLSRLRGHEGPKVVVIDPVKFIVKGNFLKPEDSQKFISQLEEDMASLKAMAILIIHIRKPQNRNSLIYPSDVYEIKGATEWVDSATTALILEKRAYQKQRLVLSFAKQRTATIDFPNFTLKFDPNTCLIEKEGVEMEEEDGETTVRLPKLHISP